MNLDPTQQKAVDDGAALAKEALTAVGTAIDSILDGGATAVPTLSGDAVAVAADVIENLCPTSIRPFVTSIITMAEGADAPVISTVNVAAGGALAVAKANVNAAIDHLESSLPGQSAQPAPTLGQQYGSKAQTLGGYSTPGGYVPPAPVPSSAAPTGAVTEGTAYNAQPGQPSVPPSSGTQAPPQHESLGQRLAEDFHNL